MADHVQHASRKGVPVHDGKTVQNIGNLAYRRIGQPLFQHGLPVGQERSHEYGDKGKHHPHPLHPAIPQEGGAEQIVHHPNDSQNARLYNHCRQNCGGWCRCGRMGGRKPRMHGKHTRLHGKAQNHCESRRTQKARVARCQIRVQHASLTERERVRIVREEVKPKQYHVRPAEGIKQVF